MPSERISRRRFGIALTSTSSVLLAGCLGNGETQDDDNQDDDHHHDDGDHHDEDGHHDDDHHDDDDDHHDDDHHDDGGNGVSDLEIIDRSSDEVVADYHGHWHGSLPEIPLGEHISLGAVFEDEDGEVIPIGDDEAYQFGARVADDAEEILSTESHGDHVHLHGESAGETAVIFQLLHDGDVERETSDPLGVTVEE